MNIKFSHNWNNKLDNSVFTTIRKFTEEKYVYYDSNVNKIFDVLLNGKLKSKAKLIRIQVCPYLNIPEEVLVLDTGETNLISVQTIFEKFGLKYIQDKMITLWFKKEMNTEKD